MSDLDKFLLPLDEKEQKEVNQKIENFIVKKKISFLRKMVKEHIFFIIGMFSLVLVSVSLLVYYYNFHYIKPVKQNLKQTQVNQVEKVNQSESLQNNQENSQTNNQTYNGVKTAELDRVLVVNKTLIEDKKKFLKESCQNLSNLNCIAKIAAQKRDPGLCVYSTNKGKCLSLYYNYLANYDKELMAKKLAIELINGNITIEDVEKKGFTPMELISVYPDERLCKYLTEEERKGMTLCSTS